MEKFLKIGELADRARCLPETIRYYERQGLLPPPGRSEKNYRLYDQTHADRLQFIRHCRSLDMTLGEIRVLLAVRDAPDVSCLEVNELLDGHIAHVAERIAEMSVLQEQLQKLRAACSTSKAAGHCGILQELAKGDDAPSATLDVHARLSN